MENKHHILHERAAWTANKDNLKLRNSLGLVATMDIYAHRELHRQCPSVPPLSTYLASLARMGYMPHPDPMRAMDNFMFAVQEASKHPRTHRIDRSLAQLTIGAVELQRPFVRDGLVDREW